MLWRVRKTVRYQSRKNHRQLVTLARRMRRMRGRQEGEMSSILVSLRESAQGDKDAAKGEGGIWNREKDITLA
jgi:hypothetical protein